MVRRDAVVGDVLEDATNGTLEHEVTEAGLVASVDCRLRCIGDGVNHCVLGRNIWSRHFSLPCRISVKSLVSLPLVVVPARSPASLLIAVVVLPSLLPIRLHSSS